MEGDLKAKKRIIGKQPDQEKLEKDRKVAIIEKVYHSEHGYRSIRDTYNQAKKLDATIKEQDVRDWKANYEPRKKQVQGYNSFIANKPFEEFQVDLMFFSEKGDEENIAQAKSSKKKYLPALIMVDTFSKYATVVLLPEGKKNAPAIAAGLMEGFGNMGGKPDTIYSDNEGGLASTAAQQFFKDEKIRHLVTRGHAPVAERTIRTIKSMLYARLDANPGKDWKDLLMQSVKSYNEVHVHRATDTTPVEATQPENQVEVKQHLENKRVSKRKYPILNIDDRVRTYHKKDAMDKERKPIWSATIYTIKDIKTDKGQKFYTLNDAKVYMRSELLKLP